MDRHARDEDVLVELTRLVNLGNTHAVELQNAYREKHIEGDELVRGARNMLIAGAGTQAPVRETPGGQLPVGSSSRTPPPREHLAGFLFFCSNKTVDECFERALFGGSRSDLRAMEKIGPRTPLLLFNFASPRRLYGPFYADGPAALCIVADAWQDGATGRGRRGGRGGRGDGEATTPYPSQVRVCRAGDVRCWRPPESAHYEMGALDGAKVAELLGHLRDSGTPAEKAYKIELRAGPASPVVRPDTDGTAAAPPAAPADADAALVAYLRDINRAWSEAACRDALCRARHGREMASNDTIVGAAVDLLMSAHQSAGPSNSPNSPNVPSAPSRGERRATCPRLGGAPTVVIDGASVASAAEPFDSGYLHVHSLRQAVSHFYARGYNTRCVVPRTWANRRPRATAEEDSKREDMYDMIKEGQAELEEVGADAGDGPSSLPYTVALAMGERAVLVTNQKHARLAGAYRLREQQDALVAWTRQWVWPFTVSRGGEILPSANFAHPEPGAEAVFDVLEAVGSDTVSGFFDSAAKSQLERDELPGTAVRRRAALEELVLRMISLASPADLGGISADSFNMKKAAWDVVNKWVYRRAPCAARAMANSATMPLMPCPSPMAPPMPAPRAQPIPAVGRSYRSLAAAATLFCPRLMIVCATGSPTSFGSLSNRVYREMKRCAALLS